MRSYLYKSQSAGVREYLCNRLYGLPEREVERYLSQVGAWATVQAAIQYVAGATWCRGMLQVAAALQSLCKLFCCLQVLHGVRHDRLSGCHVLSKQVSPPPLLLLRRSSLSCASRGREAAWRK